MLRLTCLIALVFATAFSVVGQTQTIKRKYRGIYEGTIPSYEVRMGQEVFAVNATNIRIYLSRDSLFLEIGTYHYASVYQLEKTSATFIISAERENSGIPEELTLDPKTKTIIRKGLYPQPAATLTRTGRLPRR